jgi:replication factor C subunit 1
MDHYYLSKDDWDALVELGVGEQDEEQIMKRISTSTKTSFTKK